LKHKNNEIVYAKKLKMDIEALENKINLNLILRNALNCTACQKAMLLVIESY